MKKSWILLAGVLLVLAVAVELATARIVSFAITQGMNQVAPSEQITARADKRPAVAMLGGSFDQVAIDTVNTRIDKLVFAEMHTVLQNVQLDREELFLKRRIVLKQVENISLSAAISQDELARYLNQNAKGIKNARVSVTPGKVQAVSQLSIGGLASLTVTLDGRIVSDGQRIKFVTERFLLNNNSVGNLGGSVMTEIPLVELKNLPFGVTVRDIVMEDGKVTLLAGTQAR